jgi:hypothetical protein
MADIRMGDFSFPDPRIAGKELPKEILENLPARLSKIYKDLTITYPSMKGSSGLEYARRLWSHEAGDGGALLDTASRIANAPTTQDAILGAQQVLKTTQKRNLAKFLGPVGSIYGAAQGGWDLGRLLGKTPLITDKNTTYDQFYQNMFQNLLQRGRQKASANGVV